MLLEIRKDLKDKKWKVNLRKSRQGRTLHSMIISDGLLIQMCIDHFVNLKGGNGFALEVDTSVGKYVILCRKVNNPSQQVPEMKENKNEEAGIEEIVEDVVDNGTVEEDIIEDDGKNG